MFNDEQIKALSGPLDASKVKDRKQGGANVSYIEGWHAIAEANRIFGFDAWDRRLINLERVEETTYKNSKDEDMWSVSYVATVEVQVRGKDTEGHTYNSVIRMGTGFGQGKSKDLGQAHESAVKEAETDAMKRALMTFGNPFGLALYDKDKTNVMEIKEPVTEKDKENLERIVKEWTEKIELADDHEKLKGLWKTFQPQYTHMVADGRQEFTDTASLLFTRFGDKHKALDEANAAKE